jgi:hypothetical protein
MTIQASFDFTPGITVQFPKLRDVVNAAVYNSRGSLKAVASDLDMTQSELSRMVSREKDDPRKLDVDDFVRIIESTGDTRPIQWLIEKFLRDPAQQKAQALNALASLAPMLVELAAQAGVATPKRTR